MARARKKAAREAHTFWPSHEEMARLRRELPTFQPHDLRALVAEAELAKSGLRDLDQKILTLLQRRTERQLKQLLRALSIDPSDPNAWKNGFLRLATVHHGLGHIAWSPRRTNRNSATWSPEQDEALVLDVRKLTRKGLSVNAALRKLASDPAKINRYPYRPTNHSSQSGHHERLVQALRQRWQSLRRGGDLLTMLRKALLPRDSESIFASFLDDLDFKHVMKKSAVVKIKKAPKRRVL